MGESWEHNDYLLTTDPSAIDITAVHTFLQQSGWAEGIPLAVVQQSVAHSLNFSLLQKNHFVGFARVITDYATFAYLTDVFVLADFRGQGLATWMMTCILTHPQLQGLRRWCLVTRDAQNVYARIGFTQTATPERWMEKLDLLIYERGASQQKP